MIPVAPVNPSVQAHPSIEPTPGVVNLVNPALQRQQPTEGEPVYTSVADPLKNKVQEKAPHDWTIHRPTPEKVEDPPPKPLSQVLMDHLRTMWTASASAIQIEDQDFPKRCGHFSGKAVIPAADCTRNSTTKLIAVARATVMLW